MIKVEVETGLHVGAALDWAGMTELVVGSSDECDIQLVDENVLSRHFMLLPQPNVPGSILIAAVEGRLVLDGQPVEPGSRRTLQPQAVVELGPVRLRLTGAIATQAPIRPVNEGIARAADRPRNSADATNGRTRRPKRLNSVLLIGGGILVLVVSVWPLLPSPQEDLPQADRAMLLNLGAKPGQVLNSSAGVADATLKERLVQAALSDRISIVETADGILASGTVDEAGYAAWQDVKSWYAKAYRRAPALTDHVRILARQAEQMGIGALESSPGRAIILTSGERFEEGQTLPDGSTILCVNGDVAVLLREGRQTVVLSSDTHQNRSTCSPKSKV